MGGFGSGSFGRNPFGEWGWEDAVLYESIPTVYKQADAASEQKLLRKYSEGLFGSFRNLRHLIEEYGNLRDPLLVRSEYSDAEFLVLGKQVVPSGVTQQVGYLGRVDPITPGIFIAQDRTASFTQADVGKQLFIRRSNVPENNQATFTISGIVSSTEVLTDPLIAVDPGPMRWEVRTPTSLPEGQVEVEIRGGIPQRVELGWVIEDGSKSYEVVSRQVYWQPITSNRLLNEREGSDGILALGGAGAIQAYTLSSSSYSFQSSDIGRIICVENATNLNTNGLWEIVDVIPGVGGNVAVFGRLTIPGTTSDVQGKIDYVYQTTADRLVSVAHVNPGPSSSLVVSYDESNPDRFDVTVQLATDGGGIVTSTPSQVAAALAADPIISQYIAAGQNYTGAGETPVGEIDRTIVKPGILHPQADPVFWSIRPYARLVLYGPLPLGVITEDGYDLSCSGVHPTATTTEVEVAIAPFSPEDVGRLLTISGSTVGNDGTYTISAFVDSGTAVVDAVLLPDAGPCYWAIRTTPTQQSAPTRLNPRPYEVTAHAEALLDILATDFGIKVDTQQVEERQRSWVRQVSQWSAIKGTEDSVLSVAHLSGFNAEIRSLFSIPAYPNMAPNEAAMGFAIYFVDEGRSGTTGSLTLGALGNEFTDPAITFTAADVGKTIHIQGAAAGVNNNYFVVKSYISDHTVLLWADSIGGSLGAVTTLFSPDGLNGSLVSTVGEIYCEIPPRFVLADDIDMDYLAICYDIAGRYGILESPPKANRMTLDTPCGVTFDGNTLEPTIGNTAADPLAVSACNNAEILSASNVSTTWTITVKGDDLSMFKSGGWEMKDDVGNVFYLQTPPTELSLGAPVVVAYTDSYGNPQSVTTYPDAVYELVFQSALIPVAGRKVAFTYICELAVSCAFCPTYKVIIELEKKPELIAEGTLANENAFARCESLIRDTLPANVEAVFVELP